MKLKLTFLSTVLFLIFFSSLVLADSPDNLIITEIMKDPSMVTDTNGEWFEIYNPTETDIDLRNLIIKDNGSNDFIIEGTEPIIIPAGAYFVLGRNSDISTNGGVTINYQYSGFDLGNADDEIIIINSNDEEIDRVEYDNGINWPDPSGASMMLMNPNLDNNIGSSWTTATQTYGTGDKGTPGAANFPSSTPTEIPTPTPTNTPTPTCTPTPTPTPTPSISPSATPAIPTNPTITPKPTPSPFPLPLFFQKLENRILFFFNRLNSRFCYFCP